MVFQSYYFFHILDSCVLINQRFLMQNSQDEVEYVQADEQTIRAIEQAKKLQKSSVQTENNNKQFIKDDRQVTKPKYTGQTQQSSRKQQKSNNEKSISNKKEEKKDTRNKSHQKEKKTQNGGQHKNNNQNKKSRKQVQQVDYTENKRQKAKYFEQKYQVKKYYPQVKFRDNQIYIDPEGHFDQFMSKVKKLIMKHDKITLVADGINIVKAITIAEQANNVYQNKLRRINIPGTFQVEERYIPNNKKQQAFSKFKRVSTITIELSLNYLDRRHMGYQDNIVQANYNRTGRNKNKSSNNSNKKPQNDRKNYVQSIKEKQKPKQYVQKQKQAQRIHQGEYR